MDPEVKPEGETPSAQPEPTPTPEKKFTQVEVDAFVVKAKAQTERRVRKELEAEPKAEKEKAAEPKSESKPDPKMAELESRLAFSDALEDLDWKPSKTDKELLRKMYISSGAEAMEGLAERLKPVVSPAPDPAPVVKEPEKEPEKTPRYVSPGAPSGAPVDPMSVDFTRMTADNFNQMSQEDRMKYLNGYGRSLGGAVNPFLKTPRK